MQRLARLLFVFAFISGCDSGGFRDRISQDTFRECSPPDPDGGSAGQACPEGEICIANRCYAECSDSSDCGPGERCSSGTCVISGQMRDAGGPDPCAAVVCTAPQVCHPPSLTCAACSERTVNAAPGEAGACADPTPVCDIANGACVAIAAAHCAPCNFDTECVDTAGTPIGTCVTREVLGVREQVCVAACVGGACPSGLACVNEQCVPPLDVPCTNWLAAVRHTPCLTDGACAPLGATSAVYPGACQGEDPAVPTNGTCAQPCGDSTHCWNAAGGQTCTAELFCLPP